MRDDLGRHPDGEPFAHEPDGVGMDDSLRDAAWERMVAAFRRAAPRGSAPAWLEQRVMAEVWALPARGRMGRLLEWLVEPAPVRISPLAGGAAAAASLAAMFLLFSRFPSAPAGTGGQAAGEVEPVVYVQFVLEAPSANSVAVAGDFSDWEPVFGLADPDGDGVWSGRFPVRPGVYGYMFVVDESRWLTDPNAERYQDDGFGNRNAVLAVGAGSS
jgi:hypothetical protein